MSERNSYMSDLINVAANAMSITPATDWTDKNKRKKMKDAISKVRGEFVDCKIIIGGKEKTTGATIKVYNPCEKTRQIGLSYETGVNPLLIEEAFKIASEGLKKTISGKLDADTRAIHLRKVAEELEQAKEYFAASVMSETGKTVNEANGDIEEGINFLRLGAVSAECFGNVFPRSQLRAQKNFGRFLPRGTTAGISTWNFISLFIEKIATSYAAGSPIIIKSSEQTPITAYKFVELALKFIPEEFIHYVPGSALTGQMLVRNSDTAQILFTGSDAVGELIEREAANTSSRHSKRVSLETGGHNPVILCATGILDLAIPGIAKGKTGFNGQKCSAPQSLIVVDDSPRRERMNEAVESLAEAMQSKLRGNPADNWNVTLTSLIDKEALESKLDRVEKFKKIWPEQFTKTIVHKCLGNMNGWDMDTIIFYNLTPEWKTHLLVAPEVFGPVLFVFVVPTFQEALKCASETSLRQMQSAGIYSENENEQKEFVMNMHAGNLYVNESNVGAMTVPWLQPFGYDEKVGSLTRPLICMREQSIAIWTERHGSQIKGIELC